VFWVCLMWLLTLKTAANIWRTVAFARSEGIASWSTRLQCVNMVVMPFIVPQHCCIYMAWARHKHPVVDRLGAMAGNTFTSGQHSSCQLGGLHKCAYGVGCCSYCLSNCFRSVPGWLSNACLSRVGLDTWLSTAAAAAAAAE
jgi:hypothetical protein